MSQDSEDLQDALQVAEDALQRMWDAREELISESRGFRRGSLASVAYGSVIGHLDDMLGNWMPADRLTPKRDDD